MSRITRFFLLVFLPLCLAGVVLAWVFQERVLHPVPRGKVTLFIPPGSTVREMSKLLAREGVVSDAFLFRVVAKALRKDRVLKPGEYEFNTPSSPVDVLGRLERNEMVPHRITFPEGLTMKEIATLLVERGLVPRGIFMPLLRDPILLKHYGLVADSFEGFLFPDTYQFYRTDSSRKILDTMVQRFFEEATPELRKTAENMGLDLLSWVTLASIIEKESSVPAEHPIISSVFHNRLKKKMRLQSDPTVIYGIPNFNGNLTRKDLETPTPYNTYTRAGLPPGPIASPGASALRAALHPAETEYLYFVSKQDGTHVFSKTYEEHLANVATYQLKRPKKG